MVPADGLGSSKTITTASFALKNAIQRAQSCVSMFRFSDLPTGNKELDSPSRSGPPLSHAKSHSVERGAKPSDTGESGLFRVLSSWMHYASLGLEYPQRQPKLVIFQAISDHGFKTVVIVIAFFQMADLHIHCEWDGREGRQPLPL